MRKRRWRRSAAKRKHVNRRSLIRKNSLLEPLESRLYLAAIQWSGSGDGITWSNPNNWDLGRAPAPGDDVTLNVPGDAAIQLDAAAGDVRIDSLQSDELLTLAGGSLNVAGSFLFSRDVTLAGAAPAFHFLVAVQQKRYILPIC